MPLILHALTTTLFEAALCLGLGSIAAEVLVNLDMVQAALCGRLGRVD